jgi:hypothetical protein
MKSNDDAIKNIRVMHTFHSKELNNDPVSNAIALNKGEVQNLTCNRLSHVPVQWLKVNIYLIFYGIISVSI